MVSTRDATIRIPYSQLAPGVKEMVGHAFQGSWFILMSRFLGIDRWNERLQRLVFGARGREGLLYYHQIPNSLHGNTYSVRSARLSRVLAELYGIYRISNMSKNNNPILVAATGMNISSRIEAARLVQVLHEELAKQMRHSGIVHPKYAKNYSPEVLNVKLLARTHPIFTVSPTGSIVFRRPTRTEYARYKFQSSRTGKFGVQPWTWRGYLEPPKAPQPWKKWAAEKVREWSVRWKPVPAPAPGLVPVRMKSTKKKPIPHRRRR